MKLSQLHEDGAWAAVAGHPGRLGDSGKVHVKGKGSKRMSFMTHPEQRDKWFKEDDDISEVGSKKYSDDTLKHVPQGGTPNKGEVMAPSKSDIDDVGSSKYMKNTEVPSRKLIGKAKRLSTIKV